MAAPRRRLPIPLVRKRAAIGELLVMRFRKATGFVSAGVLVGLLVAFWPGRAPQSPQLKLLRLTRTQQMAPSLPEEPFDWSTGGLFTDPNGGLSAEFEVYNPKGSGVLLSNDKVEVECLGPTGAWTAAVSKGTLGGLMDMPAYSSETYRIHWERVQAFIPSETERCRVMIFIRPPTARERCREWLARSGLWLRFPKACAWISGRLANTKRWRERRLEIELPGVPVEHGMHNERPGVDAGWPVLFAFERAWSRATQAGRSLATSLHRQESHHDQ